EVRFNEKPEQFASLAYDTMNALLDSICKAGLNRVRIHDALANIEEYDGVTGHMIFDPNQKNVAHMYLGTVHNGSITYKPAAMEKFPPSAPAHASTSNTQHSGTVPYARVGEDGVEFNGPHNAKLTTGAAKVILFGKQAAALLQSPEIRSALNKAGKSWQLLPVSSDQNWGAASTQLVHYLYDEHALAIIALDRDA